MKPFDLKAAKRGEPVVTRDGWKARIVCFDRKTEWIGGGIVAFIDTGSSELILAYDENGESCYSNSGDNLFMAPKKVERWVVVLKKTQYCANESIAVLDTKDQVDKLIGVCNKDEVLLLQKIEWEE